MRPLIRRYPRTVIIISVLLIAVFSVVGMLVAQSFRITSIQRTNNDVRITWDAPGGSNYVVQTSPKLIASNFTDLSAAMFVTGPSVVSTNYTHSGAMLNSTSRFYRVKAYFNPFTVQIQPTNAVIGVTMTNRYKVFLIYSNSPPQDVTGSATLTTLGSVAQTTGLSADGFALVKGTNTGTGSVRAVYQGVTNTVTLTVAQLTGLFTIPPLTQINSYVSASNPPVYVMGIFSNGQTNNVTPSSTLEGGAASPTRLDYYLTADVANSYALITGQSAADGNLDFLVGTNNTSSIHVNWCWFTNITMQPQNPVLNVGEVLPLSFIGHMANGSNVSIFTHIFDYEITLSSDNGGIAQADSAGLDVTAVTPGTTTVHVNSKNGPGLFCIDGLDDSTSVTVTNPPGTAVLWTNTYNGTGNSIDQASAIALDSGGNPSITGSSYGGGGNYDFATIRYSSAGVPLWTNRYNGPGNGIDSPCGIAVDLNSNVFVSGSATVAGGTTDWATIKYSPLGVPLWTNRYDGSAGSYDAPAGIAVDTAGNVFVAGDATRGSRDFATIKYSGAGVPQWTNYYNGPGNGYDSASGIALDGAGNVFVAGVSTGSGGNYDYATIKYSNSGTPLWTNRFDGPGHTNDFVTAMKVDINSNILVTGYQIFSGTGATIKYSSDGSPVWTNSYSARGATSTMPRAIACDNSGNAIVTGYISFGASDNDWVTIKYTATGIPLWTNRYDGAINNSDNANAVAVDSSGNVVVTGSSSVDAITIKYSSAGPLLWLRRYNGASGSAVAIDASGNVLVTGYGPDNNNQYDYLTLKYAP